MADTESSGIGPESKSFASVRLGVRGFSFFAGLSALFAAAAPVGRSAEPQRKIGQGHEVEEQKPDQHSRGPLARIVPA